MTEGYTVFSRSKATNKVRRIENNLTFAAARKLCETLNGPNKKNFYEFVTDKAYEEGWGGRSRRR